MQVQTIPVLQRQSNAFKIGTRYYSSLGYNSKLILNRHYIYQSIVFGSADHFRKDVLCKGCMYFLVCLFICLFVCLCVWVFALRHSNVCKDS